MISQVERWSIQIADRLRTAHRDFTETLVEIGNLLRRVRAALRHGEWLKWLESMPFAQRSAANYMNLFHWAQERPADFRRLKVLGPSKLYAILRLPGRQLRQLRLNRFYLVPGTDHERRLERMSVPEVHALIAEWLGESTPTPSIARVLSAYRQRLTRLLKATVILMVRSKELPTETIRGLKATVAEVARALGMKSLARASP